MVPSLDPAGLPLRTQTIMLAVFVVLGIGSQIFLPGAWRVAVIAAALAWAVWLGVGRWARRSS